MNTLRETQKDMELAFAKELQKPMLTTSLINRAVDYMLDFCSTSLPPKDEKGNSNQYLINIQSAVMLKGTDWIYDRVKAIIEMALQNEKTTMQALVGRIFNSLPDNLSPHTRGVLASKFLNAAYQTKLFDLDMEGNYIMFKPKNLQEMPEEAGYILPMLIPPRVKNNRNIGYLHHKEHIISGSSLKQHDKDVCLDHINRLNKTPYMIDTRVLQVTRPVFDPKPKVKDNGEWETDKDILKRKQSFNDLVDSLDDKIQIMVDAGNRFHFGHKYDNRLRTYLKAYHFNFQGQKFIRGMVQPADGCMVFKEFQDGNDFTPYEWLLIDIATNSNHGDPEETPNDKKTFRKRLEWTKETILPILEGTYNQGFKMYANVLKALLPLADEGSESLFIMGLIALWDLENGKPVNYALGHDSASSGPQLLSVLTRCITGMKNTGAIGDYVPDLYTFIGKNFSANPIRQMIKKATVPYVYGSTLTPMNVFGNDFAKFVLAYARTVPGANWSRGVLIDAWNPNAKFHEYRAPDGAFVHMKVIVKDTIKIEFAGKSNNYEYEIIGTKNRGEMGTKALSANVTHGYDAYVLRELNRRCNYNPRLVRYAKTLIERSLTDEAILDNPELTEKGEKLMELEALAHRFNTYSVVALEYIDQDSVHFMTDDYKLSMLVHIENMLQYKPFVIKNIHDDFGCLPIFVTEKKRVYNQLLAEAYESTWLFDVIQDLTGVSYHKQKLKPVDERVKQAILNNHYAIH